MGSPDYLVFGHVTRDLQPDGSTLPGGTALYAATVAARLGCQAAIFTTVDSELAHQVARPGVAVSTPASTVSSTFENRYSQRTRQQWLHAVAASLDHTGLPANWHTAPVIHIGPVLHECTPDIVAAFPCSFIGVTPQGWMRHWDAQLPAVVQRTQWRAAPHVLEQIDLLVCSVEDLEGDETRAADYVRYCRTVVITRGAAGATLYHGGQQCTIPAFPAVEVDPTGAGDVFAAAMMLRTYETGDPWDAARFASATAALTVGGAGTHTIPTRREVLRYLDAFETLRNR